MSLHYGACLGSRELIDTMSFRDFGNTRVDYIPIYDEARVGHFDIPRVGIR